MAPRDPKRQKLHHESVDDVPMRSNESREGLKAATLSHTHEQAAPSHAVQIDATAHERKLHSPDMFGLQVDEMLAAAREQFSNSVESVDQALKKLKTAIENIKEIEPRSVSHATTQMEKTHGIAIPYPNPKPDKDVAYKLSYRSPSDINVVGSYISRAASSFDQGFAADMVVTIPDSILQDKDYLNYRYFYKRAYYVACIAAGLKISVASSFDLKFDCLGDNDLHPILVATPKSSVNTVGKSTWRVNIIPAAPGKFFNAAKLQSNKNCIRPATPSGEPVQVSPTPFYNASLSMDTNIGRYSKLFHHTSTKVQGFRDACVLGSIWLHQRGLNTAISGGGFGNFEWTAITALLLQGGAKLKMFLSPGYSSLQLFRGVLQYLHTTDLAVGSTISPAGETSINDGSPVFLDSISGQNLLFKMTPSSYAVLRDEAKTALDCLNDSRFDSFEAIFIAKKDNPFLQYDLVMQASTSKDLATAHSQDHLTASLRLGSKAFEVLKRGLTDRVNLIHVQIPTSSPWDLKRHRSPTSGKVVVNLKFDTTNVERIVDHGPSADSKIEAAKFREFWGPKAELRRFRDGSILESVLWSSQPPKLMIKEICSYLLKRHFEAIISDGLNIATETPTRLISLEGSGTKAFAEIMAAFQRFEQDLRNLDGLPLQLKQIFACDPALSYSSITSPSLVVDEHYRSPVDVVIQFEGSGRWPDEVRAIQRSKIAFLLKIGTDLESSVAGLVTQLGLENVEQGLLNCSFLDVSYPEGFSFRLRIQNERESHLLDRQIKDKSTSGLVRQEATGARETYNRLFVQTPLHVQSVATLCTRFLPLSASIRLMKEWFASHLLLSHFKEEFIELLVLHSFLQPYPWSEPSSSLTGFFRTLRFVSKWDWRTTPLIVDLNNSMTSKDIDAANQRLEAWRKIDPLMSRTILLAATNHDPTGIVFTAHSPAKVVAARMTALARSAYAIIKESPSNLDMRTLFTSSLKGYDFLVHLSPKLIGHQRARNSKQSRYRNVQLANEADSPSSSSNPLDLFFEEIRSIYSTSVVFFGNVHSDSIIAGLWNPSTLSQPFKVNMSHATKPSGNKSGESEIVELDKSAILAEISRVGGELILKIEVQT